MWLSGWLVKYGLYFFWMFLHIILKLLHTCFFISIKAMQCNVTLHILSSIWEWFLDCLLCKKEHVEDCGEGLRGWSWVKGFHPWCYWKWGENCSCRECLLFWPSLRNEIRKPLEKRMFSLQVCYKYLKWKIWIMANVVEEHNTESWVYTWT